MCLSESIALSEEFQLNYTLQWQLFDLRHDDNERADPGISAALSESLETSSVWPAHAESADHLAVPDAA